MHKSKSASLINAPPYWEKTWSGIEEMRKLYKAPVDTMGSSAMGNKTSKNYKYEVLIGLMLSPQTKDEQTYKAIGALKEVGLTPGKISKMSVKEIGEIIHNVGFHNTKAKHIKEATDIILEKHKGDAPTDIEDVLELPGVGEKIALLYMQEALGKVLGIPIDTHMHRISNILQWVNSKTPDQTRKQLEKWLPKEKWNEVNHLLIGFGQTICKAKAPLCSKCLVRDSCKLWNEKTQKLKRKASISKSYKKYKIYAYYTYLSP
jgi:endonuclease-3